MSRSLAIATLSFLLDRGDKLGQGIVKEHYWLFRLGLIRID